MIHDMTLLPISSTGSRFELVVVSIITATVQVFPFLQFTFRVKLGRRILIA